MTTNAQQKDRNLLEWSARRSGAGMTVEGRDFATSDNVKITSVAEIKIVAGEIHALDDAGALLARLAPSS